jgi:parallel beta-helix repeat protein
MPTETTPIEALLRRERFVVIAGLALITALSWWWVLIGAGTGMSIGAMTTWVFPPPVRTIVAADWSATYAVVISGSSDLTLSGSVVNSNNDHTLLLSMSPGNTLTLNRLQLSEG